MKSYFRLLEYLKKYSGLLILCIIANILMAAFTVINIPLIKPIMDILIYKNYEDVEKPAEKLKFGNISEHLEYFFGNIIEKYDANKALLVVCLALILVTLLKNLFRYLGLFFMAPIRNGMVRDLRVSMYDKLVHLPISYFSEEKKGDLISKITNDIQLVENSMIAMLIFTFREPLILIGTILYMLFVSPKLFMVVLLLLVITIFIIGRISKTLKKKSLKAQNSLGQLVSVTDETIGGARTIKTYGAETYTTEKFESLNEQYRKLLNRILWRKDLSSPLTEVLAIGLFSYLFYVGTKMVHDTTLDPTTFMTFLIAFYFVIDPAKKFSAAFYSVQKGMGGLNRIENLLSQPQESLNDSSAKRLKSFDNEIRFQNVSFRYQDEEDYVLKDLNFCIPKAHTIALVGSSGAGKSTIADLLPRFYDISKGKILLDGTNIKNYKIIDLRNLISVVSQNPILFNDSIKNNICLGRDLEEEKIIQAVKSANAYEFIMNTSHGFDTIIGDQGVKLSGGQRQRLSIARALVENPPILILDEATSALDSESEKLVQQALEHVMKNRTSIIIAHRLSTIHKADQIIILEKGQIVESGTHEELLKLKGRYANFVELQMVKS